jgi:integrase
VVLEWARRQTTPYLRWLPWICCFTGCRLEEVAGAMVKDIEKVGPYWVLNVRLDHRPDDASLKTEESERRVPLHSALVGEGFIRYAQTLKSRDVNRRPELDPFRH